MHWLPSNSDYLTIFAAVLAAGTALIGIFVSLSQFTGVSRARRTVEWTSAALATEEDSARRLVLDRLKLRGQGYLVAARYVPWWRFSEAALWMLLSPAVVIVAANADRGTSYLVSSAIAGFVNLSIVGRRGVRLYSERLRVAHGFAAGGQDVEPVRTDLLAQMESGTLREFTLGFLVAAAVMGTGALTAWALTPGGGGARWVWTLAGVIACGHCFRLIQTYAKSWADQSSPT